MGKRACLWLGLVAQVAACDILSPGSTTTAVSGRVTLDGTAVSGVEVELTGWKDGGCCGVYGSAETDQSGRYLIEAAYEEYECPSLVDVGTASRRVHRLTSAAPVQQVVRCGSKSAQVDFDFTSDVWYLGARVGARGTDTLQMRVDTLRSFKGEFELSALPTPGAIHMNDVVGWVWDERRTWRYQVTGDLQISPLDSHTAWNTRNDPYVLVRAVRTGWGRVIAELAGSPFSDTVVIRIVE